ncbi:DUF4231 domain-containing protein [Nocardia gipuzkoensis]
MTEPATPHDPVLAHLDSQLSWYRSECAAAQRIYRLVKLGQIATGAFVPILAALSAPPAVTAVTAAVVVIAEGAQQLFQWQARWLLYRSTAEALKRERFLYTTHTAPYHTDSRSTTMAERLQALTSHENTQWLALHQPEEETQTTQTP